jgi:hypothetical protein
LHQLFQAYFLPWLGNFNGFTGQDFDVVLDNSLIELLSVLLAFFGRLACCCLELPVQGELSFLLSPALLLLCTLCLGLQVIVLDDLGVALE